MKTLYMTKGLPASGKTTAAKALVATQPGTKRVNKDDLRAMIDGGKWSRFSEGFVLEVRDHIVQQALKAGNHIIVDDTNLAPIHEAALRGLAKGLDAKFEILDFTHVPPEECIERDLARPNSVGQKVILDMWERYLKPAPQTPPPIDPDLENAIIVDVDGTVAEMHDRGPYDWDLVGQDLPRKFVIEIIRAKWNPVASAPAEIIFISGRDSICRKETEAWLAKHVGVGHTTLFMRPAGDTRRDSIVKREIYEREIKGKYNVVGIFDDRPQVIRECWQELGFGDRIFNVGSGKEF